ncbi:MAG: hypothetical protein AAGI52_17385 [Bacteroidota bacterium]
MRPLALLSIVLLVAACDASQPEAASRFEATVAPGTAEARVVTGAASASGSLSGQFFQVADTGDFEGVATGLVLESDDSGERFHIAGLTASALTTGTYDFASFDFDPSGGVRDGFFLIYFDGDLPLSGPVTPGDEAADFSFGLATDGTLTIRTLTDDVIEGSFAVTVELLDLDGTRDVEIEGTFTASAGALRR